VLLGIPGGTHLNYFKAIANVVIPLAVAFLFFIMMVGYPKGFVLR